MVWLRKERSHVAQRRCWKRNNCAPAPSIKEAKKPKAVRASELVQREPAGWINPFHSRLRFCCCFFLTHSSRRSNPMKLNKRQLGTSGLELTSVGFGSWAAGGGGWSFGWGPQDDEAS